jgi:hypothetical protein
VKPIEILAQAKGLLFHIDVNVCRRGPEILLCSCYPGKTESLLLTDGPADANRRAPPLGKGDTETKIDPILPWRARHFVEPANSPEPISKFVQLTLGKRDRKRLQVHGVVGIAQFDCVSVRVAQAKCMRVTGCAISPGPK